MRIVRGSNRIELYDVPKYVDEAVSVPGPVFEFVAWRSTPASGVPAAASLVSSRIRHTASTYLQGGPPAGRDRPLVALFRAGSRLPDVLALIPNVLRRSFCRALRRFRVADRRQTEQPAIFSRELLDAFIADRECGGAR
jgi:hypothetical protein